MSYSNERPINFEANIDTLEVIGSIPVQLKGIYVRNGPNPVNNTKYTHLFTGDGMLHAFYFQNNKVSYANRWVRTKHFYQEVSTNPENVILKGDLSINISNVEGVANTNIIRHAGFVLALEEAHLPVSIDLKDLSTIEHKAFGTKKTRRMTAHPKTDTKNGDLYYFGYGTPTSFSNEAIFGIIDNAGNVLAEEEFLMPFPSMVHDFAITENYILIPVFPLTASMERAKNGLPPYAWEPKYGTYLGVMSREKGVSSLQWYPVETCFAFHIMNAWENNGAILIDLIEYKEPPLFTNPDGSPLNPSSNTEGFLSRWVINLKEGEAAVNKSILSELSGEFPRIDERRSGIKYNHGWYCCNKKDAAGNVHHAMGLAHYDLRNNVINTWYWNEEVQVSEGVFVASSLNSDEGDGWILVPVWYAKKNATELVVFNALEISQGPLARIILPHRIPDGFHGNWIPDLT